MPPAADPAGAAPPALAADEARPADGASSWLPIVALAVLFVALFWPFLRARAIFYDEQARYSHCLLLPAVSALWAWEHWEELKALPRRASVFGLGVLGGSVLLYLLGRLTGINAAQHVAFLGSVVGLVWGLAGWTTLRAAAFPVGYLALTMPLPKAWDDRITLPLQRLATVVSEATFEAFGWVVVRQGNVLQLPGLKLLVEDACSGVHSLYALFCLAIAWVFFVARPRWLRWTLVLSAVPIAVIANTLRVIGSGILAYKVDPAYAQGGSHFAAGMVVFVLGAAMLLGLDWCLKPDEPEPPAA